MSLKIRVLNYNNNKFIENVIVTFFIKITYLSRSRKVVITRLLVSERDVNAFF